MAHLRPTCEQPCIPGRLWPVPAFQDLSSDQLALAACEGLAFRGASSAGLISPVGQPPPQQPEAILEGRARNRLARGVSRFFPPSVWAGGREPFLSQSLPGLMPQRDPGQPSRRGSGQGSPSAVGLQGCQQTV